MKKRLLSFALVLFLLLTGCSSAQSSVNSTHTDQTARDYDFIFVCPILENEYWESCFEGIRRADEELGITTKIIGPKTSENYPDEMTAYMQEAIDAHPDGILAYAGLDSLFPLIEQATQENIYVLALDSDAPSTSRVAYVGTDAYNAGYQAGEKMVELTGGNAKIGVLVSSKSAEKEMQVIDAFSDAIHDFSMDIVAIEEAESDPALAERKTREMLTEHPEITAMFNTAGYNVTGAARVKKALGRDDLTLIGFDDVPENLQYVREGIIDAILVQHIEQVGYQAVYLMKECVDNGILQKDSYDTGTILVTKDNVETYNHPVSASYLSDKNVTIGYYTTDTAFQDGFDDASRKSGYAYEYYQEIAALTGWNYTYIYGTRSEILEKLKAGEVDIVAGIHNTAALNAEMLFSDSPMGLDQNDRYFAVNRQREDLLSDLNAAMKELSQTNPNLASTLYQKYYVHQTQQTLSDKEKNWLQNAGTLRFGYLRRNLPLSDQDENGDPTGIVLELIDLVREYTHIEVQSISYGSIDELEAALTNKEINAAFPVFSDVWLSETKGFRQTDPILTDRVMIVYQETYSADLMNRVSISQSGVGQMYYLDTYYPHSEVMYYESIETALDAILAGEERCLIGCSSILQHFLRENQKYGDLNIAYLDSTEDFGMAVTQDNSILLGILNKLVRTTDEATVTDAMIKYSGISHAYTVEAIIKRYSLPIALILSTLLAIIVVIFLLYLWKAHFYRVRQAESNRKLEQALKSANAANEAKTRFLSSISHDIRTPMNAIIGMTSIAMKNKNDTDRVTDCLDKIDASGRHLLTLINNVLDIAKIESGKLHLTPVVFSIQNTIENLVNIVRPMLQAKNLDFEVHTHALRYEMVYADEVRINQIFMNILSNAVKYTPENGRVVVDLSEEPMQDGETVRLTYTVSDNGIGISEEFMKAMYDTFSRAKDSRINTIQGTGLGLAIVKQMVELMDGTIECESKEGVGTTFTIVLCLPFRENGSEKPTLPGVHLLVVDDDESSLECAQSILAEMQITSDLAKTGKQALEQIRASLCGEQKYDAVIIDWKMPDVNGLQLIQEINKITDGALPTVLASTYDWSDAEEEAKKYGAKAFINKPLFCSALYETLSRILCKQTALDTADNDHAQNELLHGKSLLVAEDNELNWEVISELLDTYGIRTTRAVNGQDCVDRLHACEPGTFDAVLMDIQMPVLNGRDATRLIRQSTRDDLRTLPVLAMTADAFAEDIKACLDAGMNGHISKPVDMEVLIQELQKALKSSERPE